MSAANAGRAATRRARVTSNEFVQSNEWEPMYNVIEISRLDDQRLGVRLFQRRWHKVDHHFLADQDRNTNQPHHDYVWQDCPRPARREPPAVEAPMVTAANAAISAAVATKTTAKDSDAMPPPNHERRLTFRFLTLPFRHQIAIADSLNVLTDEDRALSDEALFRELFKRAAAKGLLAKLWDETEKRHADPAPFKAMIAHTKMSDYAAIGKRMMLRALAFRFAKQLDLGETFAAPCTPDPPRQITLQWVGVDSAHNRPADECATLGKAIEKELERLGLPDVADWGKGYVWIFLN